ncbi:MAG: hypothetical protein MK212_22020, partial [Saprospiraceae bacterium]|nr:hypothetical protein [Saprospiraceae bacterium]
MKNLSILLILISLIGCTPEESADTPTTTLNRYEAYIPSADHQVRVLTRISTVDTTTGESILELSINTNYTQEASDVECLALGYVATFIGNDCWWQNDSPNEDRTNLECKLLTALDLGCQCSEKHLGSLKKAFATDSVALQN